MQRSVSPRAGISKHRQEQRAGTRATIIAGPAPVSGTYSSSTSTSLVAMERRVKPRLPATSMAFTTAW